MYFSIIFGIYNVKLLNLAKVLGYSCSSVDKAGAPCTKAVTSLQRP